MPSLLDTLPFIQRWVVPQALGFWGYALARFAVVAVILILPTTAMGATLPVLAQGVVGKNDEMAREVGAVRSEHVWGGRGRSARGLLI